MPKYLWSGKSASGLEVVEEVDAGSAAEARKILEARGWTDLRQHTSEISDFITRQIRESRSRPVEREPSPEERLQHYKGTAPGLWRNWVKSLTQSTGAIVIIGVCIALMLVERGKPGSYARLWIFALLLVFVLFLYPALWWWHKQTKRWFVRLHKAKTWHRWDEVLRCLDKLSKAERTTNIGIGAFSMARYRAMALAGLGRLDDAMACYTAAAEQAKAPEGQFHTLKAGIYRVAKQYDKALECYQLALEASTDKSAVCLGMGMLLAERLNRPHEAKVLLGQAENLQLSELQRVPVPFLRGIIAYREKDFVAMDKNIGETFSAFEKRPSSQAYIYEGSLLRCKGYLAVSSAAMGRKDEARRYYEQSKQYLALAGLNDLTADYQAFMGVK